jgi:hypothetical protein
MTFYVWHIFHCYGTFQKSLYSVPLNTCHKIIIQWPTIWEYERVYEFKIFVITVAISDITQSSVVVWSLPTHFHVTWEDNLISSFSTLHLGCFLFQYETVATSKGAYFALTINYTEIITLCTYYNFMNMYSNCCCEIWGAMAVTINSAIL